MQKTVLLDRLQATGEDRLLLSQILDRAEQVQRRNVPASTNFLSPQQQMIALDALRLAEIPETSYLLYGGYDGAERKCILFLPDWMEPVDAVACSPIRCLRATFRADKPLTHRDFLGSLMGMGVVREKIGDILVDESSTDVLVLESIQNFLLQSWLETGRTHQKITAVGLNCIHIPAIHCKEVRDTLSSMRLDAVVASGFQMARGRAAELISAGKVQLNWRNCTKGDKTVSAGDTISARGFGKIELSEVSGMTRKGRISVILKRFI